MKNIKKCLILVVSLLLLAGFMIWLFTKQWAKVYEVFDKNNELINKLSPVFLETTYNVLKEDNNQ